MDIFMLSRSAKCLWRYRVCALSAALPLIVVLLLLFKAQAASASASEEHLTATAAWEQLQQDELLIVDIRRPEEWRQTGTPQGAIRLSFEAHPEGAQGFLRDLEAALEGDKDRPFAIICRTGNRTGLLLPFLRANGFTAAKAIPEGMAGSRHGRGWLGGKLPVDP